MKASYQILFLLICQLFFIPLRLAAQTVLQIQGYNKLYLLDTGFVSESPLYTSPYEEIRMVKVSHDGAFFALLEVDHGQKGGPVNSLKVLNSKGALVYQGLPDVRHYGWDPKSNRLAYITGAFAEGEVSFVPTGFFIYDFLLNQEKRIPTEGFKPVALNWLNNTTEDAIYVECLSDEGNKRFLRYNLLRDDFETIPFKSIDVSPDGKYFTEDDVDCGCVIFKDRITQLEKGRLKLSAGQVPVGWMYNTSHLFGVISYSFNKEEKNVVIRGKTKKVPFNKSVKEGTITILDGENAQQVQLISGVLPNRPPYQSMFSEPDVILSITPSAAGNSRTALAGSAITLTPIPQRFKQ